MTNPLLQGFTVGPYRVLPRQNRLEGPEGAHHVEPKIMAVLLVLAEQPGQLVSRQTLLDEVWGDVVVLDETVTKAIQVLRGYFGDKPAHPQYIRTVPRKGYELIAPVGLLEPGSDSAGENHTAGEPARSAEADGGDGVVLRGAGGRRRRWFWLAAMVGVVIVLLVALEMGQLRGTSDAPVKLAVIPPIAAGESADLAFIGEGLADYLIDQLSRTRRLDVVARRSSFGLRDTDANVRAIGEQLDARYLVEGSLRQDSTRLLLTLFLVDTETGTNVWTTQLDGSVDDVTRLQQRSAELLRTALRRRLGIAVEAPEVNRPPIPDRAYRKFLEARYQWTLRGVRRIDRSIELLKEALVIEPDYAAAHLALAQSVAVKPFYTDEPVASQFELARASARQALMLDPSVAADVAALEGFMLFKERRWTAARDSLLQALALDPDNVNALYWYSWFLSQLGRFEEALTFLQTAQKLDPVSAVLNDRLAIAYVWAGDLASAAERYRESVDLGYVESTQPLSLMMFLYRTGRFDELVDLLVRLGGDPRWVQPVVTALADPEMRAAVSEMVDEITTPDPVLEMVRFGIWMLYGETDRAFRDFPSGPKSPYVEALWSEEAAHLRTDPRFDALLVSLGFSGEERALLPDTEKRVPSGS